MGRVQNEAPILVLAATCTSKPAGPGYEEQGALGTPDLTEWNLTKGIQSHQAFQTP